MNSIHSETPSWKPDIVLFSAGFDGHSADTFGGGFSSPDYGNLAREIMQNVVKTFEIENTLPSLAIMEGGYNIHALNTSMEHFIKQVSSYR